MTCIVGLMQDNKVYMGADGCMTWCGDNFIDHQGKIFKVGGYTFAFCGTTRIQSAIQYRFKVPKRGNMKLDKYLSTKFTDKLRDTLVAMKAIPTTDQKALNMDSSFIIARKNMLCAVSSDFCIVQVKGFLALGSGMDFALGALEATQSMKDPKKRIQIALEASGKYSPSVGPPYEVWEVK